MLCHSRNKLHLETYKEFCKYEPKVTDKDKQFIASLTIINLQGQHSCTHSKTVSHQLTLEEGAYVIGIPIMQQNPFQFALIETIFSWNVFKLRAWRYTTSMKTSSKVRNSGTFLAFLRNQSQLLLYQLIHSSRN